MDSPPCNFIPAVRTAGYGPELRCRLLAIGVVAAAAILADLSHRCLEAVEILHAGILRLGVGTELGELGFKVRPVLPNRRQRCAVTRLGSVGPQVLSLIVYGREVSQHR